MKQIIIILIAAAAFTFCACSTINKENVKMNPAMNYNELGNTGLKVSELSIGCGAFEEMDTAQARAFMDIVLDSGMNYIDIYDANPITRSNIGYALRGRRDQMIIQGHIGSYWNGTQYERTRDLEKTKKGFEEMLRLLETDHIENKKKERRMREQFGQKTFSLVSLGCAKNLVNSEQMHHLMREAGFTPVADSDGADLAIINTCGFIDAAKSEAIDCILEHAQLKAEGRLGGIIVTGCLSERYQDEIQKELPEIDAVLGVGSFGEIVKAAEAVLSHQNYRAFGDQSAPVDETPRDVSTGPA